MKNQKLHELIVQVKELAKKLGRTPLQIEFEQSGGSRWAAHRYAGGYLKLLELADLQQEKKIIANISKPKILVLDIETLPMICYVWDLWPEAIGIDQIIEDWSVGSWSAKWLGEEEVMYFDVSKNKNLRADKAILQKMWKLMDEADIVVTQNGVSFDVKKLNARFFKHKINPYASFRHYDTKLIAKKFFAFSSKSLAFMTEEFNTIYKKLEHNKFARFKLHKECMKKNQEAWKEMKEYNMQDVLSLEELFMLMLPWDKQINWNVFHDELHMVCTCGNTDFKVHKKAKHTNVGRYTRMICTKCGKEHFGRENLLDKEKRKSLTK